MTDTLPARTSRMRDRRVLAHPPEPAPPVPRVIWERIDTDCYAVSLDGETIGFIDVVGPVFVVLGGCRYDRAVEIAQSLVFEDAVGVVVSLGAP